MTKQEEQQALDKLKSMNAEGVRLSLIFLSNVAQAMPQSAPSPKPFEPIPFKLVSNSQR